MKSPFQPMWQEPDQGKAAVDILQRVTCAVPSPQCNDYSVKCTMQPANYFLLLYFPVSVLNRSFLTHMKTERRNLQNPCEANENMLKIEHGLIIIFNLALSYL